MNDKDRKAGRESKQHNEWKEATMVTSPTTSFFSRRSQYPKSARSSKFFHRSRITSSKGSISTPSRILFHAQNSTKSHVGSPSNHSSYLPPVNARLLRSNLSLRYS